MDLKQGHWKAKSCKIDYILIKNNDKYCLYGLQTGDNYIIEDDKVKMFIENHMFICDLEKVYLGYFNS